MALRIGQHFKSMYWRGSFFGDVDRDFRTVRFGEPGFVLEPRGYRAVAGLVRIAEFVELEQFWRQRLAAGVALTLVLVDMYPEFSGHESLPLDHRQLGLRGWRFLVLF
jgi:hypothetical protein